RHWPDTGRSRACSPYALLQHDDFGADRHALEQILDLVIDEAEAARRHGVADRFRRIGAVNAIDGVAKVKGARSHRIAGAASHETWQIGLALNHLGGRRPVRPFLLARDFQKARPFETFTADADAVA